MSALVRELLRRQRALAVFGLVLMALTPFAVLGQLVDARLLDGVNVWVKPAKFTASIGLYALTVAWFFAQVRPERRDSRPMRALVFAVIVSGAFEVVYITIQAARGLASHYNASAPIYIVMYAFMGLFAMVLVGASLPLAWEIGRRPAEGLRAPYRFAVVVGLVSTFVLGGLLGGYMSSQPGHSVGAVGGHVFLFGWNRLGGDLRVAHFFGIHAQQAIPLLAATVSSLRERLQWWVIACGSAAYALLTLAVFAQAVAGRALLAGG